VNKINFGGVCWTMSEPFSSKIQRILLIDPPSVSVRLRFASASKTEKFSLHFFIRAPPKLIFARLLEEKIFAMVVFTSV